MKILLDNKESEEYFYNALCNGADWLGGYGITIDYTNEASDKARKNFKNNNPDSSACREDIWMQILRDGGILEFIDHEAEEVHKITLEDVHNKVSETDAEWLLQMKNEEDDVITADCILQTVIFGEVVYG